MQPTPFSIALKLALSALLLVGVVSPTFAGETTRPIQSKKVVPLKKTPSKVTKEQDPDSPETERQTRDPLEKINRGIFAVNHQIYRFLLRPIAKATEFIIPKPVLTGIGNAFDNLESPIRIVGCLLQGKFRGAAQETGKLVVNSTFGIGGLMKPSETIPSLSNVPKEDVGQAFGKWGIPDGPYLVLPIAGPSSLRDLPGRVADTCLTPTTWVGTPALRYSLNGTRTLQLNPSRMKTYDSAREGALDEYIAVRESYLSYRAEAVRR